MAYHTLNCQKRENAMLVNIIGPVDDRIKLARLSDDLTQLYDELMGDDEIRVLVLTGDEEKSFSMETDSLGPLLGGSEEMVTKTWSLSEPIAKLDKPVITAIHGDAIGQGLELVLASDIRVSSETSHFGLTHVRSGHIPWDGGTQRLSRLIGKSNAIEMILTGKMINAREALRMGLVNKVAPSEELLPMVLDMAEAMASKGPIALKYTKEATYKGLDMTLEQGLRLEADLYLLLHTTQDRTEGIKAFREKKTPRFEGK